MERPRLEHRPPLGEGAPSSAPAVDEFATALSIRRAGHRHAQCRRESRWLGAGCRDCDGATAERRAAEEARPRGRRPGGSPVGGALLVPA